MTTIEKSSMETKSRFQLPRPFGIILSGMFMAVILYTSTMPAPKVDPTAQVLVDNVLNFAHFPIYAVLTFILLLSFCSFEFPCQVSAFLIAVFFGIFNEFVQLHTPNRSFSFSDMCVNACGSLFMIVCIRYAFKKRLF